MQNWRLWEVASETLVLFSDMDQLNQRDFTIHPFEASKEDTTRREFIVFIDKFGLIWEQRSQSGVTPWLCIRK